MHQYPTTRKCEIHNDKASDYFCKDCEGYMCSSCYDGPHKKHDVITACEQDEIKERRLSMEKIGAKARHMLDVMPDLLSIQSLTSTSCEQAEACIKRKASEMFTSIEQQTTNLLHQLHQTRDQKLIPITKKIKANERYITNAQNLEEKALDELYAMAEDNSLTCVDETALAVTFLPGNDPFIGELKGVEGHDYLLEDIELPTLWSKMDSSIPYVLVELTKDSQEYQDILHDFGMVSGVSPEDTYNIERVQNPNLYRRYILCRCKTEIRCGKQATTQSVLWHNTTSVAKDDINANGFNASHFGEGICFTVKPTTTSPSDAARTKGMAYVYRTQVITGECTVSVHNASRFDTLVDDADNPEICFVFSSDQAYPEYLITFRP